MDHDARLAPNGERDCVGDTMVDVNELNTKGPKLVQLLGADLVILHTIAKAMLGQFHVDETKSQSRSDECDGPGRGQLADEKGQRADMVFMRMGQDDGT